jgi:AcrR family transcriptional regulator
LLLPSSAFGERAELDAGQLPPPGLVDPNLSDSDDVLAFLPVVYAGVALHVADDGGVGIGTLYRRFGDRRGLGRAVALAALEQTYAAAQSAGASQQDPFAALAAYMHAVLDLRTSAVMPELLNQLAEDDPDRLKISAAIIEAVEEMINNARSEELIREELTQADMGLPLVRLSRPLVGLPLRCSCPTRTATSIWYWRGSARSSRRSAVRN